MTENYSNNEYEQHLVKEHKRTALSEYLKEIVYGGNDGIVTTFAVVAGFTGAQSGQNTLVSGSVLTVLLFGFANLFGDGTSMALGNILSIRSNADVYQSEKEKELHKIKTSPDTEKKETIHILQTKGFSQKQSETLTTIYQKNEKYWVEFMMKDELKMPNPEGENPYLSGFATFLSFLTFGFIPLVPYIIFQKSTDIFIISVFFTFLALVLLGILRWEVTRESIFRSIGEVTFLGGVSAIIAYFIGTRFAG